jgi:hypothetical protein
MEGKPPRPPKQTQLPSANKSDHNAPDAGAERAAGSRLTRGLGASCRPDSLSHAALRTFPAGRSIARC